MYNVTALLVNVSEFSVEKVLAWNFEDWFLNSKTNTYIALYCFSFYQKLKDGTEKSVKCGVAI